jgi:hypothetical protein
MLYSHMTTLASRLCQQIAVGYTGESAAASLLLYVTVRTFYGDHCAVLHWSSLLPQTQGLTLWRQVESGEFSIVVKKVQVKLSL